MTRCQFCGQQIDDVPQHYGSDSCPALLSALGPVTDAGRRRETDTHHRLNTMEAAEREMATSPVRAQGRWGARVMMKLTPRKNAAK